MCCRVLVAVVHQYSLADVLDEMEGLHHAAITVKLFCSVYNREIWYDMIWLVESISSTRPSCTTWMEWLNGYDQVIYLFTVQYCTIQHSNAIVKIAQCVQWISAIYSIGVREPFFKRENFVPVNSHTVADSKHNQNDTVLLSYHTCNLLSCPTLPCPCPCTSIRSPIDIAKCTVYSTAKWTVKVVFPVTFQRCQYWYIEPQLARGVYQSVPSHPPPSSIFLITLH
jgi:hypothetical protein